MVPSNSMILLKEQCRVERANGKIPAKWEARRGKVVHYWNGQMKAAPNNCERVILWARKCLQELLSANEVKNMVTFWIQSQNKQETEINPCQFISKKSSAGSSLFSIIRRPRNKQAQHAQTDWDLFGATWKQIRKCCYTGPWLCGGLGASSTTCRQHNISVSVLGL